MCPAAPEARSRNLNHRSEMNGLSKGCGEQVVSWPNDCYKREQRNLFALLLTMLCVEGNV